MKSNKRAMRRHHRERLFKKRYEQETRHVHYSVYSDLAEDLVCAEWRAKGRIDTGTVCSCTMCATPRKYHGNGWEGLSMAERRWVDIEAESVLELREGLDGPDPLGDEDATLQFDDRQGG